MITEKQVKALAYIVQEAKGHGWSVPSARKVAEALSPERAVSRSDERAMSALIKRLADGYNIFVKRGSGKKHRRGWYVNTRSFITECTTAAYIMCLYEMCHTPGNREKYVGKDALDSRFSAHCSSDVAVLRMVVEQSKKAGYIEETLSVEGKPLRVGLSTFQQLRWLEYLARSSSIK